MREREAMRLSGAEAVAEVSLIGQRRIMLIKAKGGWLIKAYTGNDVVKLPLSDEAFGALASLMGAVEPQYIASALDALHRSVLVEEKHKSAKGETA